MNLKRICCYIVALQFYFPAFAINTPRSAICESALVDHIELQGGGQLFSRKSGKVRLMNVSSFFGPPSRASQLVINKTVMAVFLAHESISKKPVDLRLTLVDGFLDDNNQRMPHLAEHDDESESINISMENVFTWAAQKGASPMEVMILAAATESYKRAVLHIESEFGESQLTPQDETFLQKKANESALKVLRMLIPNKKRPAG